MGLGKLKASGIWMGLLYKIFLMQSGRYVGVTEQNNTTVKTSLIATYTTDTYLQLYLPLCNTA